MSLRARSAKDVGGGIGKGTVLGSALGTGSFLSGDAGRFMKAKAARPPNKDLWRDHTLKDRPTKDSLLQVFKVRGTSQGKIGPINRIQKIPNPSKALS